MNDPYKIGERCERHLHTELDGVGEGDSENAGHESRVLYILMVWKRDREPLYSGNAATIPARLCSSCCASGWWWRGARDGLLQCCARAPATVGTRTSERNATKEEEGTCKQPDLGAADKGTLFRGDTASAGVGLWHSSPSPS